MKFRSLNTGKTYEAKATMSGRTMFTAKVEVDGYRFRILAEETIGIYQDGNADNKFEVVEDQDGIYAKWLSNIEQDKKERKELKAEKEEWRKSQMFTY